MPPDDPPQRSSGWPSHRVEPDPGATFELVDPLLPLVALIRSIAPGMRLNLVIENEHPPAPRDPRTDF